MFKINIHLFTAAGPAGVAKLNQFGPGIFLDLKFHDIPNTVAGAVESALALPGIRLLNLHALGGAEMMRAAAKAMDRAKGKKSPAARLLAVTILTSMDRAELGRVGVTGSPSTRVVRLARLAQRSGMGGVVASPLEIRAIRRACGKGFLIVTPGVRPTEARGGRGRRSSRGDDQARISTPGAAIRAGADYLVVGRPITAASDPKAAAQAILEEVDAALSQSKS